MGSDESKPSPQEQQTKAAAMQKQRAEEERLAKKIQSEKVTISLDKNIEQFNDKVKKYEVKIEVMKAKAKEMIEAGNTKDAKKLLQEATRLKKQL